MQTIENDVKSKQSSDELQSLESHEWNKPPINRYDIEEDESEKIVLDEDYQQIETKHGETKVVLCFPKEQQDTNFIKDEIKSIGNSVTCKRDLINIQDISIVFYNLAEQVSERLKKEKLYCKEIQIFVKNNLLAATEHQCKLSFPTDTSTDIGKAAIELFKQKCTLDTPIRALGIRLKDFNENLQTSLFDDAVKIDKKERIDNIINKIRNKYGSSAISRGNNLLFD